MPVVEPKLMEIKGPTYGDFIMVLKGMPDSSFICNRMPEEVALGIDEKRRGSETSIKVKKVSIDEAYEQSTYRNSKGEFIYPSHKIKNAAIEAAKGKGWWEDMDGKRFKAAVQVVGEYVVINGEPNKRKDIVFDKGRGGKIPTMRYRMELKDWQCDVRVKFNISLISQEQIIAVFNAAGFGIGIGDKTPEQGYSNGMFSVTRLSAPPKTKE